MQLRSYQNNAIIQLRQAYKDGLRSIILEAPTGAGKTIIFSRIAKNANDLKRTILIVTDRLNLNDQTDSKLEAFSARADILTVQTAIRRVDKLPKYDIVIVDEAHKKTFDNFIFKMREKHGAGWLLLGFTATPIRQSKTGPLCDIYEKIISVTTIPDLISGGFLVPAKSFGAPFDMKGIGITRGDYDVKEMFEQFDDNSLYNNVVKRYQDHANGSKAICFCINVKHSQRTAFFFKSAGITSAHLDGNAPKHHREQVLRDFASGKIRVLCNCDLYTTGFDEPSIETVILNRATRSIPLFLQMCGRGSRPFPGKDHFKIIDMANNIFTNGFWQQSRTFDLKPVKPPKAGVAPVKDCKACGAIIHASAAVCEYCGEIQPKKKKKEKHAGTFIEIDPSILERDIDTLTISELDQLRRIKKYKFGWLVRKVIERGQLEEFANQRGYSSGWIKRQKEFYNL